VASRRARLIAAALGALLALAVAESGLRLAGVSHPPFYRPDPERGWALAPGARGLYTQEGRSRVEVSSAGLRDDELPRGKPPGELRVAVLGDSVVEALQVPEEAGLTAVIERALARCAELPAGTESVEAINFGVSGYGTAQELLTLRRHALAYAPDAVVLVFYAGNDVQNNSPRLEPDRRRPFLVRGEGGGLRLDDAFRGRREHRLRSGPLGRLAYGVLARSRLLQLLGHRWQHRGGGGEPPAGAPAPSPEDAVYRQPPPDAAWAEAWKVTEALIARVAATSREAGARFLLVSASTGVQVHPDPELRRRFAADLGVADLWGPERRLAALARREGFDYLALAPPLAAEAARRGGTLHLAGGFGHWNEAGHRAAGRRVARELCRGW
jgi:hypothetical protein